MNAPLTPPLSKENTTCKKQVWVKEPSSQSEYTTTQVYIGNEKNPLVCYDYISVNKLMFYADGPLKLKKIYMMVNLSRLDMYNICSVYIGLNTSCLQIGSFLTSHTYQSGSIDQAQKIADTELQYNTKKLQWVSFIHLSQHPRTCKNICLPLSIFV